MPVEGRDRPRVHEAGGGPRVGHGGARAPPSVCRSRSWARLVSDRRQAPSGPGRARAGYPETAGAVSGPIRMIPDAPGPARPGRARPGPAEGPWRMEAASRPHGQGAAKACGGPRPKGDALRRHTRTCSAPPHTHTTRPAKARSHRTASNSESRPTTPGPLPFGAAAAARPGNGDGRGPRHSNHLSVQRRAARAAIAGPSRLVTHRSGGPGATACTAASDQAAAAGARIDGLVSCPAGPRGKGGAGPGQPPASLRRRAPSP